MPFGFLLDDDGLRICPAEPRVGTLMTHFDTDRLASYILLAVLMVTLAWKDLLSEAVIHTMLGFIGGLLHRDWRERLKRNGTGAGGV